MKQIKTIAKQANISYISKIFSKFLGYFTILLLTSFLTPNEFGAFQLMHTIIIVGVLISVFGFQGILDRYIPFLQKQKEGINKIKYLIKGIFWATTILSFSVLLIFYIFPENISTLFKTGEIGKDFIKGLKILFFLIPAITLTRITASIFRGYKNLFFPSLINNLLRPLGKTLIAAVLVIYGGSFLSWLTAYTIFIVLLAILFLYLLYDNFLKEWWNSVQEKKPDFKKLFSFTWPLTIENFFNIISSNITALMIGFFITTKEVGVHSIYIATISAVTFLGSAISKIFKPIASENGLKKLQKTNKLYKRVSKWGFLFSGAFLILIAFYGKQIIIFLFSDQYTILPISLIILSAGKLINISLGPYEQVITALGKTTWKLILSIIYTISIVILSILLIPKYSIAGAAAGLAGAEAIKALIGVLLVKYKFDINPFSFSSLNVLATLIGFLSVTFFINKYFTLNSKYVFIGLLLHSVIFAFLTYILKAFDETDWILVNKFVSKIKKNLFSYE